MTVTVAGVVESLRIDTSDPMTWSHNAGTASPQGVLVAIMHGTSATDHVVGVTYGGVALTRVQRNTDSSTEPGAAEWWFKGSSIPTGTQTVSVDLASATTDDIHGVSITLDADGDMSVVDVDGINDNAANPSVTLQYNGRTAMAFAAFYSGLSTIASLAAGANCTLFTTSELAGNFCSACIRQTTAGSSDFAISATSGTDDVAYAAVAVSEKAVGADAVSAGVGSALGIAAALALSVASVSGVGATAGVGGFVIAASGSASGIAVADGVGGLISPAVGVASGAAVTGGVSLVTVGSVAASSGAAVATGESGATVGAEGLSEGIGAAAGLTASVGPSVGASAGISSASGVSGATASSVAASSGIGAGQADAEDGAGGTTIVEADANSAGSSSAISEGAAVIGANGSSAGAGVAVADGLLIFAATGSAAGASVADGQGGIAANANITPARIATPSPISRTARTSPRILDPEVAVGGRIVRPSRRLP